MLYLIGDKEVNYIFDGRTPNEIAHRAINTYKNRPGFFTPYKNGYEFTGELIAPGVYPLAGIVTAGFSAFASVVSAVVGIGSLLVAAGSVLFSTPQFRDDALQFAGIALEYVGIALLTSAISALLAIISFPHSLISVATRSVVTVIALGSDAFLNPEPIQDNTGIDPNEDEVVLRCI